MGKIVVIEGTDFSGKSSQFDMAVEKLKKANVSFGSCSFPKYDSDSSFFVREYLHGEFGSDPNAVSAYTASTFYALDRYYSWMKDDWGKMFRNGGNVLFSRYMTSNLLHQCAKIDDFYKKRDFINWLYDLEYVKLGIPKHDVCIWLDMPIEAIKQLKEKRNAEQNGMTSNGSPVDIHEADMSYLEKAYHNARFVAEFLMWKKVKCVDANGALRSKEDINEEIMKIIMDAFKGD